MPEQFVNELARALARPDCDELTEDLERYYAQFKAGGDWPDDDDLTASFTQVMDAPFDDPDRALAYLARTASMTDDVDWLGYMAAGPLEDLLRDPADEMLSRTLDEARKTPRFRWLLSGVWLHAIAERCRAPVREAAGDWLNNNDNQPLPPRPWA